VCLLKYPKSITTQRLSPGWMPSSPLLRVPGDGSVVPTRALAVPNPLERRRLSLCGVSIVRPHDARPASEPDELLERSSRHHSHSVLTCGRVRVWTSTCSPARRLSAYSALGVS
jgi:hypothetical protein